MKTRDYDRLRYIRSVSICSPLDGGDSSSRFFGYRVRDIADLGLDVFGSVAAPRPLLLFRHDSVC